MAIAFRNKSSSDFGSGTSGTIAVPTSTASGDAVIGAISADGSGLTLSFSGGATWTHATALSITNGDAQTFRLGHKSAGASEGTNYTWNNSGGNACSVGVASYSGADSAVIDVAVVSNNPNSASPPSSPITATANSVTTVTDQDMVLVWYTVDLNGGVSGTWGSVTGATTRISQSPAQFSNMLMAEFSQSPAGATGNKTVTYTAAGNAGNPAAYTIAIKPAGAGGVTAALIGVSATGAVGSVVANDTRAATGNQATGSAGNVTASISTALTGNAATGSVGSLGANVSTALTGVAGTGAAGNVVANVSVGLTGVQATGAVGTVTPGTGISVALSGVSATGSAGNVSAAVDTALTGLGASGAAGSVTANVSPALTGNAATGSVGTLSAAVSAGLSGAQGAGQVGSVSVSGDITIALTGVEASGLVGSLSVPRQQEERPSGGYIDYGTLRERRRLRKQAEEAHERVEEGAGAEALPKPDPIVDYVPQVPRIQGRITRQMLIGRVQSADPELGIEQIALRSRRKRQQEDEELLLLLS